MRNQNLEYHLHRLRERLKNRTMSVLVGAGFSKNVDPHRYPSWFQLLEKLVITMHGERYLTEFQRYSRLPTIEPDNAEYKKFLKEEISHYIKSTGYLNVVSDYIRITGIRESIESFIEENTPIAIHDNGCDSLQFSENGVRQCIPLQPHDLDLHRKIVQLPWNNIYTTNYDNLLEHCVDNDVTERIKAKISNIGEKINPLVVKRQALQKSLNQINEEIRYSEEQLVNSMSAISSQSDPDLERMLDEKRKERLKIEKEFDRLHYRIIELSNTRADLLRSQEECFTVVSHSSLLSLKKHRNIIKLHGTIDNTDEHFEFDDDNHKRYVISSEDYEYYPSKHEAFTQLMRISLLQEYFMLIGFSGDDPNFLNWLSWVRDVLRKGKNSERLGKIYLIDLKSNGEISKSKQQFYHNHQIIHVPILSSDVISFLTPFHDSPLDVNNVRDVLSAFLNFLGEISPVNLSQIALEKLYHEEYRNFFRNLPFYFDKNTPVDFTYFLNNIYVIRDNRHFNRITSIQSSFTFSKINFIESYGDLVEKFPDYHEMLFETVVTCLVDLHIPFRSIVKETSCLSDEIEKMLSDYNNCSSQLQWLQAFNSLWFDSIEDFKIVLDDSNKLQLDVKNQMLSLAYTFNFEFANLQALLDSWQTTDYWTTIKAGILSLTNADLSRKILKKNAISTAQEELLSIELQLHLSGFDRDVRLVDMYDEMAHAGLSKLSVMMDRLLDDLVAKNNRVEVLGSNKFASGEGLHLTNISEERSALQVFGLLMESGFPLSTSSSVVTSFPRMFPAIVIGMKFFPIPVLSYSLQYDDIQFLKRIGQEFSYDPKVDPYHEIIVKNFTNSFLSDATPKRLKINQLRFFSEFIISVKPEIWEQIFTDIWREGYASSQVFGDSSDPYVQVVVKCLPFVKSDVSVAVILSDCLYVGAGSNIDGRIRCLFHLANNPALQLFAKELRLSVGDRIINDLINAVPVNNWHLIQILNSFKIFTIADRAAVQNVLNAIDLRNADPRLIEAVFTMVDDSNRTARKRFVKDLLVNKALWRSGVSDDRLTVSGPVSFINLRLLRLRPACLVLTKVQANVVYEKMLLEIEKISDYMSRWNRVDGFLNFRAILQQMLWFLEDEVTALHVRNDYERTLIVVSELFSQNMDVSGRLEALLSNNAVDINWAIIGISRDLFDYGKYSMHDAEIRQIVTRVSMKSLVGLESCIFHLVKWFYHARRGEDMKMFANSAIVMMDRYLNDSYPVGCEIPLIEENLVRLAFVLRSWGYASDCVQYFCEKIHTSRFNTVRYSLLSELQDDSLL